jgi:predicted dehydrogenase
MGKDHPIFSRKLRWGMVGGGPGAFIGAVHRRAAQMDGQIELVAGAFDVNPEKSKQMGRELYLDDSRVYGTYTEMIERESKLPTDKRIDFVTLVTPNFLHFPIARDFLKAGFHVVCEKPMTMNVKEAKDLVKIVQKSGKLFGLQHNYTGYPMVKLARDMVRQGDLGRLLKIVVQYPQGWLIKRLEKQGSMQAEWRTDPKRAGAAGCIGDIGTHAENLAEYISGLKILELCADLTSFIPGRQLDDDGNCLVRFEKGVKGLLFASQISVGEENGLAIKVYGENASLAWRQEDPNFLRVLKQNAPVAIWSRGNGYVAEKSPAAARATRLPPGHPEAFFEAFANLYGNFAETLRCTEAKVPVPELAGDFPNVEDGLRGMVFIETVVKSAKLGSKWVKMPK